MARSLWPIALCLWATTTIVASQEEPSDDDRIFETPLCRCERGTEEFYTDDSPDVFSKWLFPRDDNNFFIVGDVTILPRDDVLCYVEVEPTDLSTSLSSIIRTTTQPSLFATGR